MGKPLQPDLGKKMTPTDGRGVLFFPRSGCKVLVSPEHKMKLSPRASLNFPAKSASRVERARISAAK